MFDKSEYMKTYNQEKADYLREYHRKYNEKNKEKIKQQHRERYLLTNGKGRKHKEKPHTSTDFSGIYGIECKATGQWYIGQSVNVLRRLRHHMKQLSIGEHENHKLQDVFNRFCITGFNLTVLQVCDVSNLNYFEHKYITEYNSVEQGMNLYTPTPDDM